MRCNADGVIFDRSEGDQVLKTVARCPKWIARQGTAYDIGHNILALPNIDELALLRWRRCSEGHVSTPSSLGAR